ncbi:MAG: hemerythrin family protein [Pseudomonadota bacterium]
MSYPDWAIVLDIGDPVIDEQHKHLFAIANDLMAATGRGEGEDMLKNIFERLKAYTRYHFEEEEAFMERIGYPDRDAHVAEHVLLLIRVNTLWRLIEHGEIITPNGISLFVNDWIVEHIMHKDALIGEYARARS